MKKFFAMMMALACVFGAWATEYSGKLTVSINGTATSQETTITIQQAADGTYTLLLKNFCLDNAGQKIGVGNIQVDSIQGTTELGYTSIAVNKNITITAGDDPEVDTWLGPLLGEVPLELKASFSDQVSSVTIAIDMMETLQQKINVDFIGTNPEATPAGLKGDVNNDGSVDINDVNSVINILLGKD